MSYKQDRGPRAQQLAASLRVAASRAAEVAGDGLALVFTTGVDSPGRQAAPRLRAVAGFPSRDAAMKAAEQVQSALCGVLDSGEATTAQIGAEEGLIDGAAEVRLLPLRFEDRVHGVLVVAAPSRLPDPAVQRLSQLVASTSLRLDHSHLLQETEGRDARSDGATSEAGDELLKLSEALFAQDIELLRNTEKLGRIEKLKNDFIEKMSRELRTPLNNIIEAIISVISNENDRLSTQSLGSLRGALEQGTAFQRTLQNILDLWRIKQNELPIQIQEVNLSELVDEAIFSVQETIGRKPIRIEKRVEEPMPKLRTDLAKLNQVLFLILDNAAKFTEQGRIEISVRIGCGELVCSVQDTGIGICPDDQQAIFDEFYQVDDLASTRYTGAGLGLSLAKDLLVLLHGEISLSSEAGKGTTFTFRVPVEEV